MKISYIFKSATKALWANKARSSLTILGIVIGITAIILVISLGKGAQNLILGQVQGMGTQTIAVVPGREPTGPSDVSSLYSDSLKQKDVVALENSTNVPGLKSIIPVVFGADSASYDSNTYQINIFGSTELMAQIFDLNPKEGTFFDENDVLGRSDVVVIGSKIEDHLFPNGNAMGQKIKIKGRNFKVIGILPPTGGGSLFNFDDMALVPYTTAQYYILGIKYFNRLIIEAKDGEDVAIVAEDIRLTLRESHNITDPSKEDFFVQTQQDLAKRLSTITNALTWFLVAVASISLFVGGVGIMNIMLVSVTERTSEIGLRKALGAKNHNILSQFLLEAVLLTAIGGVIGIILGSILALIVSVVLSKGLGVSWEYIFPWGGAALGISVSTFIGLVFGIFPARSASRKSPMEALRYE